MKPSFVILVSGLGYAVVATALLSPTSHGAVNTVGHPNILWRAKINGQNKLWYMNGPYYESETSIMATGGTDHNWRTVGVGDFDGNGQVDILWQHEQIDASAIWFMNGISYQSAGLIPNTGDTNWRMAAVADFNRDGKADILWQYRDSTLLAAWLMNGATPWHTALLGTQPASPDWRAVGAGDFNNDGVPDIVWRNRTGIGENAIWYMEGSLGLEYQSSADRQRRGALPRDQPDYPKEGSHWRRMECGRVQRAAP